jgi:hypothetical protein
MDEVPAVVRKVGEGMDKPDGDKELPLDVSYQKLIDFLVSAMLSIAWGGLHAGDRSGACDHLCAPAPPTALLNARMACEVGAPEAAQGLAQARSGDQRQGSRGDQGGAQRHACRPQGRARCAARLLQGQGDPRCAGCHRGADSLRRARGRSGHLGQDRQGVREQGCAHPASSHSHAHTHAEPCRLLRSCAMRHARSSPCMRALPPCMPRMARPASRLPPLAHAAAAVFLGEAAQSLVQNADYEIPFIRKQGQRLDQQVTDCDRKHAEYIKNAAQCAANFEQVRSVSLGPRMHNAAWQENSHMHASIPLESPAVTPSRMLHGAGV